MASTDIRMGPWRPLYEHLVQRGDEAEIFLEYDQIESILGMSLPIPARSRRDWWTVIPLKQRARSWLAAYRHSAPNTTGVTFRKTEHLAAHSIEEQRQARQLVDNHAVSALLSAPASDDIGRGWWEPHRVYVVQFPTAEVTKVGLTHMTTDRIRMFERVGGTVLQVNSAQNRWSATVIEGAFLRLADLYRVEPPLWLAQSAGFTEFWKDAFQAPVLEEVMHTVGSIAGIPSWSHSVKR